MNKLFVYALVVSLSFNALFGYLSYQFHSAKAVAVSNLQTCKESNERLVKSLEKQENLCRATDDVLSSYQKEKLVVVEDTETTLKAVDALPQTLPETSPNPVKKATENHVESDVVSLDSRLPSELIRVLSEDCNRTKGNACNSP